MRWHRAIGRASKAWPARHRRCAAKAMAGVPEDGLTHLRVTLSETAYLGPGRADLLEQIAATGSISAAGKAMGMSYKRAWELVQALNEGFGFALVETSRGGSGQG